MKWKEPIVAHKGFPLCPIDVSSQYCGRQMSWEVKDHLQLGAALDLFDFEAAANVAGAKFYYMRRAGMPSHPRFPAPNVGTALCTHNCAPS